VESVYSEGVPLGGLNPTDINYAKWGTQIRKNGSRKFVLSSPADVEKFAEFNGEIMFQIRAKMAHRTSSRRPGQTKTTIAKT